MKICIDIQSAITQRTGIGRYTRALVEALGAETGTDTLRLFYFDFQRRGIPFPVPGAEQRAVRWIPGKLVQQAWKTADWPPFDWLAGRADIYHFPNFTLPSLGCGKGVVTIHDMSFLRYPGFAEARNQRYLATTIRRTVARADAIITDSEFSAAEIQTYLPVEASRLWPIHLGIATDLRAPDQPTVETCRKRLGLDRPYLLTVGTLEPRKNIPFLVEVFEKLQSFDGLLVIAGMPGWKYEPILERFRSSPAADRIRYLRYVPECDLPALYAGAELLVFPSFYEGFGFPPLEAMACGCPVVTSAGGSLPEIVGNAAPIIQGFNADEWVEQIHRILADSTGRATRIRRGIEWVKQFTWAETARRTWEVYRKVGA